VPKVVDHQERRIKLIEATWRMIVRDGWDAATMSAIATEAGFANGALRPYFATKEDLLTAAFDHIYVQTGSRTIRATEGQHGIAALRSWCLEILPLDDTTRDEARLVIPFWQVALTDDGLAERHERAMCEWRAQIRHYLTEAREAGEISTDLSDDQIIGHLLAALLGTQITASLLPSLETPQTLLNQLDGYLALLSPPL
jgi:AcrR family transcriptional regulator